MFLCYKDEVTTENERNNEMITKTFRVYHVEMPAIEAYVCPIFTESLIKIDNFRNEFE